MKKILIYISIAIFIISCKSGEVEYPDFTYQTVYFPIQYPVRNLVLGESRADNTIDLEHAFSISVNISGVYENTKERVVFVRYAPELVTDTLLVTDKGDTIAVLPENYYSNDLRALDKIVIPAGSFDGRVRINLTDEFFKDPKTALVKYVIPLVILPTTEDSVLTGRPIEGVVNPKRVVSASWQSGYSPMDFTLFGIKYTNLYHGNYFHYGVDSVFKADTLFAKPTKYRPVYADSTTLNVIASNITMVKTVSLTQSTIDRLGGTNVGAKFMMKLKFNEDKTISLDSIAGSARVIGNGKLIDAQNGVVWGEKGHTTIVLNYKFSDTNGAEHRCHDTLVYRTSGITFQEFKLK